MLLDNVEILASGTWPGSSTIELDNDDLQGIVDSFNALGLSGRLPLKLGHEGPDVRNDPTTQFALGWVKRIWVEGSVLKAAFDMPKKVYDAVKDGYLKFVSVELKKNVEVGNRRIPWLLDAVALLGSDHPAVGILKDLQSLTFRVRPSLRKGAVVTFALGSREHKSAHEEPEMDKAELDKAVKEAVNLALKPVNDQLETAKKENEELKKKFDTQEADKKKAEIKLKRDKIDELFNVAIEDGGILPKVRESYIRLTRYDKKDEAVEEIDLKEVKEYIKDNTDEVALAASKKKKAKELATQQGSQDEDADKPADVRLANRVKKVCASRGKDPLDATYAAQVAVEILREDKELATAYRDSPTTEQDKKTAGGK